MVGEKYESWEKIMVDELTAFMCFMLLMGIIRLPSTPDYWKRDEVMYSNSVLVKNKKRCQLKSMAQELEGQHAVQKTPLQPSQVVMTR